MEWAEPQMQESFCVIVTQDGGGGDTVVSLHPGSSVSLQPLQRLYRCKVTPLPHRH